MCIRDRFGRVLGRFKIEHPIEGYSMTLNDWMVKEYHAAPYFGQSKDKIAEIHLENRKKARDIRDDNDQ